MKRNQKWQLWIDGECLLTGSRQDIAAEVYFRGLKGGFEILPA